MIVALPHFEVPVLVAPAPQIELVKRKKRRGSERDRRAAIVGTTLVVGMIILGDDGQPCQIVALNPDGVSGHCVPVNQ